MTFRIGWSSQRSFLICTCNEHIIYITDSYVWTVPCLFHYIMKYRCISRHTRKLFLNHLLPHCWLNKVIPGFQDLKRVPIQTVVEGCSVVPVTAESALLFHRILAQHMEKMMELIAYATHCLPQFSAALFCTVVCTVLTLTKKLKPVPF